MELLNITTKQRNQRQMANAQVNLDIHGKY